MDKLKLISSLCLFALGSFLIFANGVQTGAKDAKIYSLEQLVEQQNKFLSSKKFNENRNKFMPGSGRVMEEIHKASQYE